MRLLYILTILFHIYCGLLFTRFCFPTLLSKKRRFHYGILISIVFCSIFLVGVLSAHIQLYRCAYVIVAIAYCFFVHERKTEKIFWLFSFFCITAILTDLSIIVLRYRFDMRLAQQGIPEIKILFESLAFAVSLTLGYLYITVQKKSCDCDLRSFTITFFICLLMVGVVDTVFLVYSSTLTNFTPFIIISIICLIIICLSILLLKRLSLWNKQLIALKREQLYRKNAEEQIQEISKFYDLISSLKHDINQQITIADTLDVQGYPSEKKDFLNELKSSLPLTYDTGIPSVNALLSFKAYECRKANIEFKCQICNLQEHPMDIIDITSVLNNLLNNAIEAQVTEERLSENKYIQLMVKRTRNVLFIECINSVFRTIHKDDTGKIISTKPGNQHGYGIESIKTIVKQSGGECSFIVRDKEFIVSIYIPYKI